MSKNDIKVDIPKVWLPSRPEINIKFLNGEVTIPSHPGGYVIASGCGSGKTTAIRQIILERFREGIVYSAFTIEECNDMFRFLKENGSQVGLYPEDIVVLHSDYKSEGVNNNLIWNDHDSLKCKKVIICTHHKLLNEYPGLFQEYYGNVVYKQSLSILKRHAIDGFDEQGRKYYPRQLIIVDEMPTCNSANFRITKGQIKALGIPDTIQKLDKDGKPYFTAKLPLHFTNGDDYSIMQAMFEESGSMIELFRKDTKSGKLMNEIALSMIFDNYDTLINSDRDELDMTYTLADQVFEELGLRIILFDGTGDLTFINSKRFHLLTYDEKYSSPVTFNVLPFKVDRNYKSIESFMTHYNQIIAGLNYRINDVIGMLLNGHKVLIVTWKNFKIKGNPIDLPIAENDARSITISDYINSQLRSNGFVENDQYSIIHYQSGLDRATNRYADYDTILFLGEFHVPNYVVDKFNQDYRVKTSEENYLTYQLIQAICRLRIRKHKGEGVDIYFTEDWNNKVIDNLKNYLISDDVNTDIRDTTLNWIRPKWRGAIDTLCNLDSELRLAIETGRPYRLEFSLDDIYELIPVDRKEVNKYNSFVNYLKTLGIELIIKSNSNRTKNKI